MINAAKVDIVMAIHEAAARGKRGVFLRACDVPLSVRPGEIQIVEVDPAAVAARLQREIARLTTVQIRLSPMACVDPQQKKSDRHASRNGAVKPICPRCLQELARVGEPEDVRFICQRCGKNYR